MANTKITNHIVDSTVITGQTAVTAADGDYLLVADASDSNALKKVLASDLIQTSEEVADIVGAMVSSNTETGITVTYEDSDNTIDFAVGTLNQNTTGSAATLTTPRAIAVAGDVTGTANFDGSAGISITTTLATDAIVTANITNANVTLAKMAANSVDSDQYVDGSIDTAHYADNSITGAKLADSIEIVTNLSVGSSNSAGSITTFKGNTSGAGNSSESSYIYHNNASNTSLHIGNNYSDANAAIIFENNNTDLLTIKGSGLVQAAKSAAIAQVAITSSSNAVAWDSVAAANAYHVTTENTTFSAPSNAVEGAIISVEIAQGGTARTIAWNTVFEFAASTAPTITATANKTDILAFRYNGSVWQEIGRVQNMAQT